MSILEEAKKRYKMYLDAEEKILIHSQSYELEDGSKLTRANLGEIRSTIQRLEHKISSLEGAPRTFRAIPRDL